MGRAERPSARHDPRPANLPGGRIGPRAAGLWLALAASLVLSGSAPPARRLPSDAFVWQLAWRPAVARAVADNAGVFAAWHVLTAEIFAGGPPAVARPDWPILLAAAHGAVPVIRIEGRIDGPRAAALAEQVRALLSRVPGRVRAVEIDHDAATARLGDYASFLATLRTALPQGTRLWITALPTWIASADFRTLVARADRLILQVHAIDDPRMGLFSARRALVFARAMAARAPDTPFQVALPAYGARVSSGAGLSVSAEAPAGDAQPGQEIAADPAEVARFVAAMERDPPDRLLGFVWFRLPVAGDARVWGAATLRHVAGGRVPDGRAVVLVRAARAAGARDILVGNTGQDDVVLPRHIALPETCLAADGLGQYVLEPGRLALRGAGLLGGGAWVLAGWMRCSGDVHVED